jgi:hypothetical protein
MASMSLTGTQNLTFLHIPQNAGLSINRWLELVVKEYTEKTYPDATAPHCCNFGPMIADWPTLSNLRSQVPRNYTFTIVRNPWDRVVSVYSRIATLLPDSERQEFLANNGWTEMPSFTEFVTKGYDPGITATGWGLDPDSPQSAWIDTDVELIVKLENLEADIQPIRDMFGGATSAIPKLNASTRNSDYTTYYNDTTKNIIATVFAEDIAKWGYTF